MPSPRTVLADINDLGLDPNTAHTHTSKSGRLKTPSTPIVESEPIVELEVVVELVEPVEPEPVVELAVEPEPVVELEVEQESVKEKKRGRGRKVVS